MNTITPNMLNSLLNSSLDDLMLQASEVRRKYCDSQVKPCSIINAKSGLCSEDCKFCAQSAISKASIDVYPLKSQSEIVAAARFASQSGALNFGIVTSGNKLTTQELDTIAAAAAQIKEELNIGICGSLGALDKAAMRLLKQAGVSRYHHNIETSRRFYSHIVSTHSFAQRLRTIEYAREVGLEVCSGGIIGLGETMQDRFEMACLLKQLDVDSVPLNILVAIRGTALEKTTPLTPEEVLRTICIFRIVLQDRELKIAAGREKILQDQQLDAFVAGATGMIIGGYLTIKGDALERDRQLILAIEKAWRT